MISFHGKQEIKQKYLERVKEHFEADEIIKGKYWEKGKGCAVGCTIHENDHSKYEIELGIPEILAILEDGIFEDLPNERAKTWPIEFLDAIPIGVDLYEVWPKFAIWLLTDKDYGVVKYAKSEKSINCINTIADYYSLYEKITAKQWEDAYADASAASADAYADAHAASADAADAVSSAAYASASASAYAADVAADAANVASAAAAASASAYAADVAADAANVAASAGYAASAAAYATADAADAVSSAAYASAYAADVAVYAVTAYVVRKNYRIAQANKLLELLRECR